MAHDRWVAGMRCSEVLGGLPDYLDDELSPEVRARVEAHLRGCDWCEQFGGHYAALVGTLRERLVSADDPDAQTRRRLRDRLGLGHDDAGR